MNTLVLNKKKITLILLIILSCISGLFLNASFRIFFINTVCSFLNKTLRNKNLWLIMLREVNAIIFLLSILCISLVSLCKKKINISTVTAFSITLLLFFTLSTLFHFSQPEQTGGYWSYFDYSDMFLSIYNAKENYADIYPPFATMLYHLLFRLFPIGESQLSTLTTEIIAFSYAGNYVLLLFFIFSIVPLCILSFYAINGNIIEKTLFSFSILLSGPILFAIERGNIIVLSLELTFLFCVTYNSKNDFLAEIGLWALAAAAAIKIYPAIFGLLLVKNKDWEKTIRCTIYGIFIFIAPILFFNEPLTVFSTFINNLYQYANTHLDGWYTYALKAIIWKYFSLFSANSVFLSIVYNIFLLLYICLSAIVVFISKKKWHILLICALFCMILPSAAWAYTNIFLIIPLIALFNEKDKNIFDKFSLITLLWLFLYVCFNVPILTAFASPDHWQLPYVLFILTVIDVIQQQIKSHKRIPAHVQK